MTRSLWKIFALACGLVVLTVSAGPARAQTTRPASPAALPDGVAATVNGEQILDRDLVAGLPDDALESSLRAARQYKLNRMVEYIVQKQFLKDHGVEVPREAFDKGMEDFVVMVKTPGCPCCGGGYENLDQFMKANGYTIEEVHQRVTCEVGFRLYAERLAKDRLSPEALAKEAQKRKADIEAHFLKGASLSFEYLQDGNYVRSDKAAQAVKAAKEKLAGEAYSRLQKGEPFEKVAKEMSEDKASAARVALLACVPAEALDLEVAKAIRALPSGSFSKPIKTAQGYWVVQADKLTDEDVLAIVRKQAMASVEDRIYDEYKAARNKAAILYKDPSLAR